MRLGSDELPWGAHSEPGVWVVFVVVVEPPGDLPERGERVRQRVDANIVALEGFDEASEMPFDSGLWTGVKQGTRLSAVTKSRVSLAV